MSTQGESHRATPSSPSCHGQRTKEADDAEAKIAEYTCPKLLLIEGREARAPKSKSILGQMPSSIREASSRLRAWWQRWVDEKSDLAKERNCSRVVRTL
jgi:hypothetical protein